MADIPRRKIDTTAVIEWIRMVARTSSPDNANAVDFWNFAIVNDNLVWVDSLGNVHTVISGAGAPNDATYITQTANAGLTNEQVLASLSTGMMKVTTTTGVITSVPWSAFYTFVGNTPLGDHMTSQAGVGVTTRAECRIPDHVTTLTVAKVVAFWSNQTGNEQYDINIDYAAVTEVFNAGSGSLLNQSLIDTGSNDLYEMSFLSLVGSVTGGDALGVAVTNDQIASGLFRGLGVYLEGY